MSDLPNELWFQILSHIPDAEVDKLFGVNRFFYEYILDRRYYGVQFARVTPYSVKRVQMLFDPSIARRVRFLTVQISALDQFEHALDIARRPPPLPANIPVETRPKKRWWSFFFRRKRTRQPVSPPSPIEHLAETPKSPKEPPADVTSKLPDYPLLGEVFHNLANVDEFSINWAGVGDISLVPSLLGFCWSTLRLRTLSLSVPPSGLSTILTGIHNVSTLQTISITFPQPLQGPYDVPATGVGETIEYLVQMINASRESLVSLKIRSMVYRDLSSLFPQLETIPRLRAFEFCMPRGHATLDMASALSKFLQAHDGTLMNLSLNAALHGTQGNIYLQKDMVHLAHLKSLEINPFALVPKSVGIDSLCKYFSQLNSLVITDVALSSDDLQVLMGAGSHSQLTKLHICIQQFDQSTVYLFIERLPSLQELLVNVQSLDYETQSAWALAESTFPAWSLYDLTVQRTDVSGFQISYMVMMALALAIPSIRSFCGSAAVFDISMGHFARTRPFAIMAH